MAHELVLHASVIVGVGLLLALIFWLVRRHQAAQLRVVQALAERRGWTLERIREPLAWGLRLRTTRWTLEALSRSHGREHGPGSVDVDMRTRWSAPVAGPALMIGALRAAPDLGAPGRRAMELLVEREAGGLQRVDAGSAALRARYMLWAESAADLETLLTEDLEAALLAWRGPPPLIRRGATGLEVELAGAHLKEPDELEALVGLGEALLAASQAGAASR